MMDDVFTDLQQQIEKTIDALKKHLSAIRTGRASPALLDGVRVDYYGTMSPIPQVASVTTPDARQLMIKPWEKGIVKAIEKAILESNLGLVPTSDSEGIRIIIPALTEERRKDFVKQSHKRAEEARVAARNARRDANELLKSLTKDGDISEDDEKKGLKEVQDMTDQSIRDIDHLVAVKEKEIMTV